MNQVVAIDLGSNTMRAVLYDCQSGEIVASFEKTVRLAQNIAREKIISDEALNRVVTAILQMPPQFRQHKIKAVTTQALRIAKNKKQVLHTIKQKTAIEFEIISGEDEAKYTTLAVQNRLQKLQVKSDSFVLVDIGGGSTEVIFCNNGLIESKSFPLGIVTATEIGIESIQEEFEKIANFCKGKKFEYFVSTAGTPTTVAAVKMGLDCNSYDARKINGMRIGLSDLNYTLNKLLSLSKAQREKLVGVHRDDLIITGIEILKRFFELLKVPYSIVIDDGLREGVAIALCKKLLFRFKSK